MNIALFHFDMYATYSNWVFVYDELDVTMLRNQIHIILYDNNIDI